MANLHKAYYTNGILWFWLLKEKIVTVKMFDLQNFK